MRLFPLQIPATDTSLLPAHLSLRARFDQIFHPRPQEVILFKELGHYGRLGNQLWQIAATMGIAATRGGEAHFPDWPYRQHFSVPARHFSTVTPPGEDAWALVPHLPHPGMYYLQDLALWHQIERRVRRYFRPSAATLAEMKPKFAELLALPRKTAVHVRRGDYVRLADHHPPATEDYYRRALEMLGETNVVVFSDDVEWCREHLAWARPAAFVEGNSDYEDLFLMTRCRYHVIANSSFSWWGAFLSDNREPIYPVRWFGPSHAQLDPSLMFPDRWIGIDA